MADLLVVLLLVPLPALASVWTEVYTSCSKIDLCSCELDDGKVVDLHRAAGAADGKPLFLLSINTTVYTFSPCGARSCKYPDPAADADDTVICLEPNTSIALASTAVFKTLGTALILTYSNSSGGAITSQVLLECSQREEFLLTRQSSDGYFFTLRTSCACPGTCTVSAHTISPGTILVCIFLSCCLLYFGIGCIYKKTVYGAVGTEMLPHGNFWWSLPGLIRDGYLFFISPCLGNSAMYQTYNRL